MNMLRRTTAPGTVAREEVTGIEGRTAVATAVVVCS